MFCAHHLFGADSSGHFVYGAKLLPGQAREGAIAHVDVGRVSCVPNTAMSAPRDDILHGE
jgi:hypothetical protein